MAEWSIAAVLKTVEGNTSGGSNPSLSAIKPDYQAFVVFTPNYLSASYRKKNIEDSSQSYSRQTVQ